LLPRKSHTPRGLGGLCGSVRSKAPKVSVANLRNAGLAIGDTIRLNRFKHGETSDTLARVVAKKGQRNSLLQVTCPSQ
jgi:hypothetical protein